MLADGDERAVHRSWFAAVLSEEPVRMCRERLGGDPASTMQTDRRARAMYMAADRPAKRIAVVTQVVFRSAYLSTIGAMATAPSCLVARRVYACALLLLGTTLSYSTRAVGSLGGSISSKRST